MSERSIEYVALKKLRADPRNPKAHAGDAIAHSVGRFGFVEPIVIDERTGFIASGHGRVSTLTKMRVDGDAAPAGVRVTSKGEWLIPVVKGWASASDAEAGAALIAFNRTTELGGWVDEALLDLLQEIDDAGNDVEGLGYDDTELGNLRTYLDRDDATDGSAARDLDALAEEFGEPTVDDGRVRVPILLERETAARLRRALRESDDDAEPMMRRALDFLEGVTVTYKSPKAKAAGSDDSHYSDL